MNLVRLLLLIGWAAVAWATVRAAGMGLGLAGDFFFGDMGHPWRGQFNIDFQAHLTPFVGLFAIMGGAFFSFAYLLVRSYGGDQTCGICCLGGTTATQETYYDR
jgi:hypothetical protein